MWPHVPPCPELRSKWMSLTSDGIHPSTRKSEQASLTFQRTIDKDVQALPISTTWSPRNQQVTLVPVLLASEQVEGSGLLELQLLISDSLPSRLDAPQPLLWPPLPGFPITPSQQSRCFLPELILSCPPTAGCVLLAFPHSTNPPSSCWSLFFASGHTLVAWGPHSFVLFQVEGTLKSKEICIRS